MGPRVLEVGCGPGHLLLDLFDAGYAAVGIDRSPAMWRRASERLRRAGRPGRVVGADARDLPLASDRFDSLVYTFPTPVVREAAFWNEAIRVVRPGGRIVIVEGAVSDTRVWPGLIERLWGALAGRKEGDEPEEGPLKLPNGGQATDRIAARRVVLRTARGTVWLIIAEVG